MASFIFYTSSKSGRTLCPILYIKRPKIHFDFMDVISLHSGYQQHVSATHVDIFSVVRTRIQIIIIFLHGLGRLTCSGIDALPSFSGVSTVSSSSRFVVEGVFRESGVVHSFKVVDPVLFVFESHVLYSRNL